MKVFTKAEVNQINKTRALMNRKSKDIRRMVAEVRTGKPSYLDPDDFDAGKLAATCDTADAAMFEVLNVAHAYLDDEIARDGAVHVGTEWPKKEEEDGTE